MSEFKKKYQVSPEELAKDEEIRRKEIEEKQKASRDAKTLKEHEKESRRKAEEHTGVSAGLEDR